MGIRPHIVFEDVLPKLDGGYKNIGLIDPVVYTPRTITQGAPQSPPDLSGGDKWKEFSLSLSIGDMISQADLKNYNKLLKNIDAITQAMVALIKILRILTSDLKSINRALKFIIKQIVITLKDIIESFMSTGIYFTIIRPKQSEHDHGYIIPTWADFNEFKHVVIAACTDYNDKGSPSQFNFDAQVGGFIIGGVAGSNDPGAIDYIYHNMKLLGHLFSFEPSLPGPPKYSMAVGGIYNSKSGIKLTWNRPDSFIFGGFYIYRSMNKDGDFPTADQMTAIINNAPIAQDPSQVRNFQKIKIFDNDADSTKPFNQGTGKPFFVKAMPGVTSYSYTDFDIEDGKMYYYKVYTVFSDSPSGISGDPFLFRVNSPLASNIAGAVAHGCIPVSEIENGILTIEGDWIDEVVHAKSKWLKVSLKDLLGPEVDKLLKTIEKFADKLIGYVNTSTDAINDYLDFFSNKINDYIKIIQIITQIIQILMNFRLKGSVVLLNLTDVKTGGIQGFAERISKATVDSAILGRLPKSESEIVGGLTAGTEINEAISNDMGQALSQLKGIYYGLVMVYGVGQPSDIKAYAAPYMEEYNDVAQQLADSQKSINMLLKILLGKGS